MTDSRRYRISSSTGQFVKIYPIIAEIVEEVGLEGPAKFRFAVAVTEAYTNAFYHGNKCSAEKAIDLVFGWNSEEFWLEISDEGSGKVGDLNLDQEVETVPTEKTSGRGIAIMKSFADKIQVTERDGGGLRVRLGWSRACSPRKEAPTNLS